MKISRKLVKKFFSAINGIIIMLREEKSLIVHFVFTAIIIALGLWFNVSNVHWAILILTCAMVIGLEIVNSGVENLVDMISFKYNLKSKKIKDIMASAVFISSIFAFIIGLVIFIPYFINKIN